MNDYTVFDQQPIVVLKYVGQPVTVCGQIAMKAGDLCLLHSAEDDGERVMVLKLDGTYFGMHQAQDYAVMNVLSLPTKFSN